MQATHSTSSTRGQDGGILQQPARWTYTTVSWDYPPSPAACYDALLARGASHSRFLRIAYLSTRHRCSSSPTSSLDTLLHPSTRPDSSHRKQSLHITPTLPYPISRSWRPRSANPTSHTLKRRKPQWSKPPHYHASLLRSPLSHRKGLFRAVLPPNKAVDFFRWDILVGAGFSRSPSCQERDWSKWGGADASLDAAESVLEPYEAAAGFFGWHGLGMDLTRRGDDEACCWDEALHDGAAKCRPSGSRFKIDEAAVEEGRASWTRTAEELVGPLGLALRSVVVDDKDTLSPVSTRRDDAHPPSTISSRRGEVRWDPDIGSSSFRLPRTASTSDGKRQLPSSSSAASAAGFSSSSKLGLKSDSPSVWWYGPPPHRGPPPSLHAPPFRFLPPPSVQYGPPPVQFSPWFPGSRVASAQGHGYWYGAPPVGELIVFS